jgi:hypothetical protein
MSDPLFRQHKKFIKKKANEVVIGGESQTIRVPGSINAASISIEQPYQSPQTSDPKVFQVLYTDGFSHEWKQEKVQTLISSDHSVGLDYVFVNSSRGFFGKDQVIINPYGATRETGVIAYNTLETKMYLNNTTSHPHYIGETIVKI